MTGFSNHADPAASQFEYSRQSITSWLAKSTFRRYANGLGRQAIHAIIYILQQLLDLYLRSSKTFLISWVDDMWTFCNAVGEFQPPAIQLLVVPDPEVTRFLTPQVCSGLLAPSTSPGVYLQTTKFIELVNATPALTFGSSLSSPLIQIFPVSGPPRVAFCHQKQHRNFSSSPSPSNNTQVDFLIDSFDLQLSRDFRSHLLLLERWFRFPPPEKQMATRTPENSHR